MSLNYVVGYVIFHRLKLKKNKKNNHMQNLVILLHYYYYGNIINDVIYC